MASSPPVKGNGGSTLGGAVPPGSGDAPPPPTTKWPKWRITMLIGALILLAAAILDAAVEGMPDWLRVATFFAGYVLLAYGFFSAMAARNRGGPTPRDRG